MNWNVKSSTGICNWKILLPKWNSLVLYCINWLKKIQDKKKTARAKVEARKAALRAESEADPSSLIDDVLDEDILF